MLQEIKEDFKAIYNIEAKKFIFSPGRINLIGEHIDYNGGNVFPAAISYGTYLAFSAREDKIIRVFSQNFQKEGIVTIALDNLVKASDGKWWNFVLGVLTVMEKHGYPLTKGCDIFIVGTIPNGAGLSSSASLEMGIAKLVTILEDYSIHNQQLALFSQEAENTFIGVNCGIMDMFAIGMGEKNGALLLNCLTQNYEMKPFILDDYQLVILNTNKRRELADSKYNERRLECEAALKIIQKQYEIDYLCELKPYDLANVESLLADDVLFRRVRHVVTEQQRTLLTAAALQEQNLKEVGTLLKESHLSLALDYEVTGIELDTLVEVTMDQLGVIGARMTGAGFGGCALAIIEKDKVDMVLDKVKKAYVQMIGYEPSFYFPAISEGTREVYL